MPVSKSIKKAVLPHLIRAIMVLITFTCRVKWHNRQALENAMAADQGYIIAMWHNCSTIAGWVMRNTEGTVIVSESRDGEYVSRLANLFGIKTIRGSSSSGALKAMRAAMELLRRGRPIAVTPDGPRGPRYKIQSGSLWLAASNHAPIVPMHIESTRQWVLNSWDRHRFPKPFSTIHVSVGDPIFLERADLEADLDKVSNDVEHQMMLNVERTQAACKKT